MDGIHEKALNSMFDDMDDFESKKMFGEPGESENKGVSITISVSPQGDIMTEDEGAELPSNPIGMNKGGVAKENCYSEGGVVDPVSEEAEDLKLPPYLRKKKKLSAN